MLLFVIVMAFCFVVSILTEGSRAKNIRASIREVDKPAPSGGKRVRRSRQRNDAQLTLRGWLLKRGWHGTARHCEGVVLFPGGALDVAAEQRADRVDMFFKHPPTWLLKHPQYGSCFERQTKGWYRLHQHQYFRNVHQAILGAESFVNACYREPARAA